MKNLKMYLTALMLIVFPVILTAQDKGKKTETVVFATSIECNDCVNNIMSHIPLEKGIKDVKCDLSNSQVSVTYQKEKTNPEEIQRSIEKLGYTAKQTPVKDKKEENKK